MTETPDLGKRENSFIRKLTEEEIIEIVKGLFDSSIGILDPKGPRDRFTPMAWGTWNNRLAAYDVNPQHVNVLFFYKQIGRIDVIRKEDLKTILDRYHETKKILEEIKPEDPHE